MASSDAIWSPPMGEMGVFMAEGIGGLMTDGMFELMAEEVDVLIAWNNGCIRGRVKGWYNERVNGLH